MLELVDALRAHGAADQAGVREVLHPGVRALTTDLSEQNPEPGAARTASVSSPAPLREADHHVSVASAPPSNRALRLIRIASGVPFGDSHTDGD